MKVLDADLDKKPTEKKVRELAELRIRNLLCFDELQHYNDKGKFLYKHPLIKSQSERASLEKLFKTDPGEFLKQYNSCTNNIKRYRSFLKREDRKEKRTSDRDLLSSHLEREVLFKSIIKDNNGQDN